MQLIRFNPRIRKRALLPSWNASGPSRMLPPKPPAQTLMASTSYTPKRSIVVPLVWAVPAVLFHLRISGGTLEPPGLQAALRMIRRGRANTLIVAKLDRLSQSLRDV